MHDEVDERNIPVSAGIPRIIYISALVGLVMILTMVTLVFANSAANHAWPSSSAVSLPLK